MPYNPNLPQEGTPLDAAEMRGQLQGLKLLIDATPIGQQGPPGPGFNLRGEYATGTTYQPADVVTWNGNIYLANTTTTQPPDVLPDWSPLGIVGPAGPPGPAGAPGPNLAMLGDWLDYQTYVPGDVVAYNGQIYVTMSGAAGTPPDQSPNWKLLSITGTPGAPGEVTTLQLNETLRTQAARNVDAVPFLESTGFSAEGQIITEKINQMLAALKNPV